MSSETDRALRETFEKHWTVLHDEQLVAAAVVANTRNFIKQYVAHRNGVISPTLQRLKTLVGEYGHNLLIEDVVKDESPKIDEGGPIQATLLLLRDMTRHTKAPLRSSDSPQTAPRERLRFMHARVAYRTRMVSPVTVRPYRGGAVCREDRRNIPRYRAACSRALAAVCAQGRRLLC